MTEGNGGPNGSNGGAVVGTDRVKQGLAQMLKGGVIVSCIQGENDDGIQLHRIIVFVVLDQATAQSVLCVF